MKEVVSLMEFKDSGKAGQLARHELNWWKAHHRGLKEELLEEMARLYALLFELDLKDAKLAVQHRVRAASWHDEAERLEDAGKRQEAEVYWRKTEDELNKHYLVLLQLTRKKSPKR